MSTNDDGKASFFARYIDNPPEKERLEPEIIGMGEDTKRLLHWLRNHWTKPTATTRDIYTYGPNPIRGDKKTTLRIAETLAEQGWLVPLESYRYDRREWEIVRRPTPRPQP